MVPVESLIQKMTKEYLMLSCVCMVNREELTMAVYFDREDNSKNALSTYGIIDLLGKYLVSPMMQRSADAKRVVQGREALAEQRSYAEGQARMQAEQKGSRRCSESPGSWVGRMLLACLPQALADWRGLRNTQWYEYKSDLVPPAFENFPC